MKLKLTTLVLTFLATISFSLTRERAWENLSGPAVDPAGTDGQKVIARDARESRLTEALADFSERFGSGVRFRFAGTQPNPTQIYGFRSRAYPGRAEDQSRAFLAEHRSLLGIDESERELLLLRTVENSTGRHLRFQPRFLGIPIHEAYVDVHVNDSGEVWMVNTRDASEELVYDGPPLVGFDRAVTLALMEKRVRGLRLPPQSSLVIMPDHKRARVAWKVHLAAIEPMADWEILVDARTSQIITARNLLQFANGTGRVFVPNPVVAIKDNTLRDLNDNASAVPVETYATRVLPDLDSSGTLSGPYVNTGRSVNRATENSFRFEYLRSDKRFEEVNVYYHIDSMQRYIQSLGFTRIVNRSIPVDVHAQKFPDGRTLGDDSFYSVLDGGLYFGDGGVDDAEDGEIIAHEYAHAMINDQVPGIGSSRETGAFIEGFADFWAASYFAPTSGGYQDACIADWDSTAFSSETPPCLRRLDRNKRYPDDMTGDPHQDGEIWGQALWQILQLLGREKTNRLILESHALLSPAADFREAANAILQTNQILFQSAQQAALQQVFLNRGIFSDSDANTIPLFTGFPQTGVIEAGVTSGGKFSPVQYTVVVSSTSGSVRIDLEGLDPADLDLFVRRNQPVTIGSDGVPIADARSQGPTGREAVFLSKTGSPPLLPGTYYITLANFSSVPSRYRITATVTPEISLDSQFLKSGEAVDGIIPGRHGVSPELGAVPFVFEVLAGTTLLEVDLFSRTPAEIDLYGRHGTRVQQSSSGSIVADIYSENPGGEEHLYLTNASIPALRPGVYFFAISTRETRTVEYTIKLTAHTTPLDKKLLFPLFLTGKEPSLGTESFLTGMALLNDSGQAAVATVEALGTDGVRLADPVQRVLQNGEQFPITIHDLFGLKGFENHRGWVEVSSNVQLKGFYLLFDLAFSTVMDGSNAALEGSNFLIFPTVERQGDGHNTVVSLCNTSGSPANVLFQEYNPAGQKVFSEVIRIPARGSFIGATRGFDRAGGHIQVSSDQPLAGVEFFGDGRKMAALKAVSPGTRNIMYYPQFASNRGYETTFSVTNPTQKTGELLILGFRGDGDLRAILPREVGPNSQIVTSVSELFGFDPADQVEVGFLRVQSNSLEELVGFAKIDYTEAGGASSSAIPAMSIPQRTLTFSHVANDVPSGREGPNGLYTTGIALLTEDTTASYDIAVYDKSGKLMLVSNPLSLPKGQKVSKILAGPDQATAFLGPRLVAGTGYIRVRSNVPIYGFELFFTRDLFINCAVPPQ